MFCFSFILGVLVHFAGYSTYKTMNADVLYGDFAVYSPMRIVKLGRWGIPLFEHLRGGVAANVLVSLISILLLALSAVFLTEILEIKDGFGFQFLVCGLVMVSPAYASLITYFYCSDIYTLAILLLVAGVYAVRRYKFIGAGTGIAMICLSLSIYQAYIGIAAVLFVYCICLDILREKSFVENMRNLVKYLFCGGVGVGAYYVLTLCVHKILGVGFDSYRGADQISFVKILKQFPNSFVEAFKAFKAYFVEERFLSNNIWHLDYLHTGLFIITAILLVYAIIKRKIYKNIGNLILLAVCILSYPIAVNLIVVLAPTTGITLLMTIPIGFVCPVLLGIVADIITSMKKQVLPWLCCLGISVVIIFNYSFMDNASYMSRSWIYDKTYSIAARIYDRIELLYEESDTDKVMIVGNVNSNICFYSVKNSILDYASNEIPRGNLTWGGSYGDEKRHWNRIFNMMLEVAYNDDYTEEEYINVVESEEFASMGIFPSANSVQVIDGFIVVKVSGSEPFMP